MPKAKFEDIYKDIKRKIESGEFESQKLLPSENTFIVEYDCSRNTVRRALTNLAKEGYVQPMQGRGVRVIYQPGHEAGFVIGGIETFKERAIRNHHDGITKVVVFTEIVADERIASKSGFPVGAELYYIQRVRVLDGIASILDIHLFLKDLVPGLTEEIAGSSIYEYIENKLGMEIVTSKRMMTVEKNNQIDGKYLELSDYNCVAVITCQTYNDEGIQFEFTQSRHRPDYFCFQDTATRKNIKN